MENNKIPNIRFKGFTDPWEQRKFGDGMDLLTGYPFESEKFSDNGINLIRGMNVKRGYLDLSNSLCMKWKSSEGLEKYLLENEDILIQMDGALIGKSYAKIKETQLPALLVQRVTRARAIPEKSNSDFMYQTIQRDFLKYIILNKTDSAVPHLSLNDIREFPTRFPNLEEQKKIGEYFSNLDNLITLHQRKYNKLLNVKKSMLEKMFPKNGSNIPEIRFKGFTDPWEQRKLGTTNTFFTDGNYGEAYPKSSDMTDSSRGIPFLTGGNLNDGKLSLDGASYITPEKHSKLTSGHLLEDDIVIAVRGSLGALGYVNTDNSGWNINSQLAILRTDKSELYGKFLIQYLLSWTGQNELLKRQTGSALKQLSIGAIKDVEVPITSVAEQEKIGEYFADLDNLITLHQRELEKLQNIKKSMLEKMFV